MYSDITYTGGTASEASQAIESILNLTANDEEYLEWEDNTTVGYPTQPAPTFADMYANYPKNSTGGDMDNKEAYALVGGDVHSRFLSNMLLYWNACALRVSRALNYSGVTIPNIPDVTLQGADGKYYFVSSIQLYKFLKKTFANVPKVELNESDGGTQGKLFRGKLGNAKGIFLMQPQNPGLFKAYGHATLFSDGVAIGGHDYFNAHGGVKRVVVWKLN